MLRSSPTALRVRWRDVCPPAGPSCRRHREPPEGLLSCRYLVLAVALSGNAGYARDRLPGDVERLAMIGFTVADVDRETTFFTKVLSFEKVSDFRLIGGEYDKME